MLNLLVVQALFGDSMLIEFGSKVHPRYLLIDGGPGTVYENHLRTQLETIKGKPPRLEMVMLSHVDNDHVIGLLDLMAELQEQRVSETPSLVEVGSIWHNSFSQTVGRDNNIEARMEAAFNSAASRGVRMASVGDTINGVGQGNQLRLAAISMGIPINPGFDCGLVSLDTARRPVRLGSLKIYVVGPTQKNLEKLRKDWLKWLDDHEDQIASATPEVAAAMDSKVPNLSSIMVMLEWRGKRILMTGDGRGDHLIQGLDEAGLLADGKLHVDILKLPHHGSARNVNEQFFENVTADTYVISADGTNDNPDLVTLQWLVETAKKQNRKIHIYATNETDATITLLDECKPEEFGYTLTYWSPANNRL